MSTEGNDRKNEIARTAALAFAHALASVYRAQLGQRLIGAYLIGSIAHGGFKGTTVCQLHMRKFNDGDEIYVEPWRVGAFPVVRDLVTNRSAFDRIIEAGGYVSENTGGAPDGNAVPIPKEKQETAMDAAACIG